MQGNEVELANLRSSYKLYSNMIKGIKKYGQLHSKYSSDMKMMMILDKITLMSIGANQAIHGQIDTEIEKAERKGAIPEDLLNNFDKLGHEIDNVFDSLIEDFKFLMDKIGNIDNLYERVDQKLDMILSSPDYVPGQKMMNNAKAHFEKTSE